MPPPSRIEEAKAVIYRYYAKHGAMPTFGVFAEEMGYKSTATANYTIQALLAAGYLTQAERGGRLLPGSKFTRVDASAAMAKGMGVPPEITASLPAGVQLTVLTVPDDSLEEHSICEGDMLVVVDLDQTKLSDLILQSRGTALYLGTDRKPGWKALGLLVAQYRRYSRRSHGRWPNE